jgi:hypothetical protein
MGPVRETVKRMNDNNKAIYRQDYAIIRAPFPLCLGDVSLRDDATFPSQVLLRCLTVPLVDLSPSSRGGTVARVHGVFMPLHGFFACRLTDGTCERNSKKRNDNNKATYRQDYAIIRAPFPLCLGDVSLRTMRLLILGVELVNSTRLAE